MNRKRCHPKKSKSSFRIPAYLCFKGSSEHISLKEINYHSYISKVNKDFKNDKITNQIITPIMKEILKQQSVMRNSL